MTKYSLNGRLAVSLLALLATAGFTAGQTPTKPDTTSPAGTTTPPGQNPSRNPTTTAPGPVPPKNPATTVPGPGATKVPGPGQGTFKRWGLSLHSGISLPHGDFDTSFNPGPNFAIDLEYRINPTFSLEGIYGFHHFLGGTSIGVTRIDDLNLHQFSLNGKVYGSTSPVRPFFNFGGGGYHFDTISTRGGLNVGGGVQFDVTPTFAVEVVYNFHNVFTSGRSTTFSTVQGGVRFRF